MEGIVSLIVLIVIFNIFSAIVRAIRGGGAARQGRQDLPGTPAGPERPVQKIKLWIDDLESDDSDLVAESSPAGQQVYDEAYYAPLEPEPFEEEDSTEEEYIPPPPPLHPAAEKPPVREPVRLKGMLASRESLLSAFVFHEILEPPPSLRRK